MNIKHISIKGIKLIIELIGCVYLAEIMIANVFEIFR